MKYALKELVGFYAIADHNDTVVAFANHGGFEAADKLVQQANAHDDFVAARGEVFALPDLPGIEVDPLRRSGVPVLAGTRFTVAQLLAELAEGNRSLNQIAFDFDLPYSTARLALESLAAALDRPAQGRTS